MIKIKFRVIVIVTSLVVGISMANCGCISENEWDLSGKDAKRAPKAGSQMRFDSFSERWVNCARVNNDKNYYLDVPGGLWYYEKRNERNEKIKLYIIPEPPVDGHPAPISLLIVDIASLPSKTTDAITGDRVTGR
jgi:hypothetical protein